ncbi:hypothetical protein R1sor_010719 [Riccia sorocarpa]|uniref:Amino acid transporter transmembrane domain-containing protein n=1 Tax=Riccia sorocarpa TaxID=122646 RepID=A0ABD3HYV9_9MARC
MTPVALSLEELLPDKTDSREARAYSLLIRTGLVLSTVGVAILIPFFGLVMAFIGAFLSMTVSLILPCMCYLRIIGDSATISQRLLCGFIIMVGLLCAFGGTYSSVAEIVRSYLEM